MASSSGVSHGGAEKERASPPDSVHRLVVDHSERQSPLVDAVGRSGWFDVQMDCLATGDYLVNGEALVERKTIHDLAASLLDGRLFPQVARPALAQRLLSQFGSIERVVTMDAATLAQVPGIGARTAARIRELVDDSSPAGSVRQRT